jgi:cytochrome c5
MEKGKWFLVGRWDSVLLMLTVTSLLGLSACYYDNEEELYGADCDTTAVSFADDIWPIINGNCQTGCHGPGGGGNGIFTDHASVAAKVTNGTMLLRVVEQQNMPPNGELTTCQVELFRAWILNGAPNN